MKVLPKRIGASPKPSRPFLPKLEQPPVWVASGNLAGVLLVITNAVAGFNPARSSHFSHSTGYLGGCFPLALIQGVDVYHSFSRALLQAPIEVRKLELALLLLFSWRHLLIQATCHKSRWLDSTPRAHLHCHCRCSSCSRIPRCSRTRWLAAEARRGPVPFNSSRCGGTRACDEGRRAGSAYAG